MDGLIIAVLVLFALLGAPLFAVFGAAALLLFGTSPDADHGLTGAVDDIFGKQFANQPMLATIPLFTFAGYLMAESGTPRRLVELSRAWLGWLPGGLAIVCLMASAFFTSFTGGSGITIVAIGGLLFPALLREHYPERFSLGLVTTGGSLGLLFPPSVPMILYAVVAGVMVEKLFLAGFIPGLLTVGALSFYAIRVGRQREVQSTRFTLREALGATWTAKWELLLPVAIVGGLYSGMLRLNEAAALAPVYVLIIEVFVYKDIGLRRDLPRIIRESTTLVGGILLILAAATGFTGYLIAEEIPSKVVDAMDTVIGSPLMFLLVLNLFLIAAGMLMDIFSAIVVIVPLIVPMAQEFDINPYHLGVVFLLNLEIGYMTPPVGLNLFISSFRFDKPVVLLYRSVLPFIGLLAVALVLTTYVEELSTSMAGLLESEDEDVVQQFGGGFGGDGDDEAPLPALEPPDEGAGGGMDLDALEGGDDGMDLDALEEQSPTLDDLEDEDSGGEPTLDDLERGL